MYLTNTRTSGKIFKQLLLAVLGIFFWFLLSADSVLAATLQLSPSSGSYTAGQTFTSSIRVQPSGKSVNAVEATINFDPKVLSVVSVSKEGSAFSLWTVEPTFSNTNGTISFGGGSPTPFTTTSSIITVTFRAVVEGSAPVTFSNASVLAADGRGTNVYEASAGGTFTVAATAPAQTPTPTPTPSQSPATPPSSSSQAGNSPEQALIFGDPPRAPEVGSTAFLDPELWYKSTDGVFTWTLPFDINAVAIEIASSSDNVPSKNKSSIIDPPVDEYRVTKDQVVDGEQYFSIQFKNQVGWGATFNRKLRIDTTAPEPFEIVVRMGTTPSAFPVILFEAGDKTSGIARYELVVHDREPITITPEEAKIGYLIKDLEDGTYTIRVTAFDQAGNSREASKALLITAGWIKPVEIAEDSSWLDFFTPSNLLIILLLVVIVLQFIYIWYERKLISQKEDKLRRETREVQDQMEKIFSALRDEIYDQVNMITKRKRLSKNEKEAVEGLNQALEVSETLIEKEINDVKTILK